MNTRQLEALRSQRIAGALALVLLLLVSGAAQATDSDSAKNACSTSITACGCTITKTGTYTVTANLSSTQGLTGAGDCIAIKANSVVLVLNGFSITGPGTGSSTGAGIDVLKDAKRDFIEGSTEGGTLVTAWKYGLEVQGKNTISDDVFTSVNVVGVFLFKAAGANINDFELGGNSVYGIWIKGGKNNQVNCANTGGNETGVYIGCHGDDTRGTSCGSGSATSSGNRIYDFGSNDNSDAGIVIDVGNQNNVVTDVGVGGNTGGVDSIDENANCGTNRWVASGGTDFGVTSQACIP
ncbi:MAG: hypothetical protein WBY93_01610 [Candidatus Binatus sp.]